MCPLTYQTHRVSFLKVVLAHSGAQLCKDWGRFVRQKHQRELVHILAPVQAVRHLASDLYLPEPLFSAL